MTQANNETKVRELVEPDSADRLIRYLDTIQARQRDRGVSARDWRNQPWIDADFTNMKDIGAALDAEDLFIRNVLFIKNIL